MELPYDFKNNMKNILKNDYNDYIEILNLKPKKGIRINDLKISCENFKSLLNKNLEQIPWCNLGFYYTDNFKPSKNIYYNAGLYYIQEPSAMSVGSLIEINEGDKVLDLCAAPGGKTTHIASRLKNKGLIVANDISASRCKALIKNIELMGIKNFCVLSESPKNLTYRFKGFFNKIIIDAPCSGEGMFRKDNKIIKSWSMENIKKFHSIQKEILNLSVKMLAPNGIISYSTCTLNLYENENTIYEFLKENKDFSLLEIDHKKYKISKGIANEKYSKDFEKCGRIWPHKNEGEGHFIALLKKNNTYEKNTCDITCEYNYKNYKKNLDIFYNFCDGNIFYKPESNLISHNQNLLEVSKLLPNLKGLRVIRSGWHIGFIKNNRFEPSQSFAMGLKKEQVKKTITLKKNDILRYLKGESFEVNNSFEGWNLVCLENFPLGWGKIVNGRLKNKYLRSWLNN